MQKLSSNMEDYLESMYHIEMTQGIIRVKDVAEHLDVAPPSVTEVVHKLEKLGFVVHETYGHIKLTEKGRKIGREVNGRHKILTQFLTDILKIDPQTAEKDACQMEHVLSTYTLERLIKFIEFMKSNAKLT